MKRLHVGSGSVYLSPGWLNVDVPSPKTFLAAARPDLVEKWKTTEDQYYARHADKNIETLRVGPLDQEYVCDEFGTFEQLPPGLFEEVLARHSFEHLSITEARRALKVLNWKIMHGGVLRLDVPDHEATLRLFKETGDEFYIRHLLGPRRGDYGYHMMSYRKDHLRDLVEDYGFCFVGEESNIHVYPAFTLRFQKA